MSVPACAENVEQFAAERSGIELDHGRERDVFT